jgi:hypothetical protein
LESSNGAMVSYSLGGIHIFRTYPAPDPWLKALNPQWLVIVGSAEHGDAIAQTQGYVNHVRTVLPNAAIGVRWWKDDDVLLRLWDETRQRIDAAGQLYEERYFKLAVPNTWLMVGNEDATTKTDPAVYARTVALHTEVVKRATAARIPIGTCCTAMGQPEYGQYELLAPLFKAMADARKVGVYHLWRPNAYFPHNHDDGLIKDLAQRHQREGRKVAAEAGVQFPPMALGEYNTVRSLNESLSGPIGMGIPAQQWMDALLYANVDVPYAIYCYGDGLYDDRWREFNVARNPAYMQAMVERLPRRAKPLLEDWRDSVTLPPPLPYPEPESLGDLIDGVVKMVAANWVNIRSLPSASATKVGELRAGDTVQYREPVIEAGGYITSAGVANTWRSVSNGWVAEALLTIEPAAPPEVPVVDLMLPFVSQLGTDADLRQNDCGMAAAQALALWRLQQAGFGDMPLLRKVDNLIPVSPLALADNPVPVSKLRDYLTLLGVQHQYSNALTPDAIIQELDKGRPVLILLNYKYVRTGSKRLGHYLLVRGYTENSFIVNDSYLEGEGHRMTRAELQSALTDLKNEDGSSFASLPYQGIKLDYAA